MSPAFNSFTTEYSVLLPYGTTSTPAVIIKTPVSQAAVAIREAKDVTSPDPLLRTTSITVASGDSTSVRVYHVVFRVDDKQPVFFEDFDASGPDQYIGSPVAFPFRSSAKATFVPSDTIRIDPWGSKFTGGSGYRKLYISPIDHPGFDTLTFEGIDVSGTKDHEISFAFRWNTGWSGIDNYFPGC